MVCVVLGTGMNVPVDVELLEELAVMVVLHALDTPVPAADPLGSTLVPVPVYDAAGALPFAYGYGAAVDRCGW